MRAFPTLFLLATWFAPIFPAVAAAQQWSRFRGPSGAGQSEARGIPTRWTEADYNWKARLPGLGHGSPVVWGDRIFLLSADPESAARYVLCFDAADGKRIWIRQFASTPHRLHVRNSYASSTPAVDARGVYLAWAAPDKTTLMALDHDGRTAWERDLGPFVGMHGFGASPIVYGEMVVLAVQQQGVLLDPGQAPGESFIIAVDGRSGRVLWKTPRRSMKATYSTPCVYRLDDGSAELIFSSQAHGIAGIDPKTGREKWAIDVFDKRTVGSPIVAGGLVFASCGAGEGGTYLVAVRPGPKPQLAYTIKTQPPYVPTPVARGRLVFLWSDRGVVTCLRAADGKVFWRERVGGNYAASPVRVGDRIYGTSEDGVVVVLAAEKEFKLLARNPLGEPTRATPAVAGGRMYLRTESGLISIGSPSR